MNLGDPELELIDPTPNIHALFVHFDKIFFCTKLAARAVVRWSKRMYSCAGVCAYGGRNGSVCDIALSEPLLKLRPRKDLIETLLHEMIHAFLFVTNRDDDRDGHGPNFLAHMHRINKQAGLNISVYHSFHDEVKLYQTHWWRCTGPCVKVRPYFGIVRRSANRAPGPSDCWWQAHQRQCGGTFVKIKEPDHKKPKNKENKPVKSKPTADITKYIINNNNNITSKTKGVSDLNGFKDLGINGKQNVKQKSPNTVPKIPPKVIGSPIKNIPPFSGVGKTLADKTKDINKDLRRSNSVVETVRNVWAKKQIPSLISSPRSQNTKPNLKRSNTVSQSTPTKKVKKIDDYFLTNASFILKDVYGKDFELLKTNNGDKLKVVSVAEVLVDCPICNAKVDSVKINSHIDECLNKDLIEKISNEDIPGVTDSKENIVKVKHEIIDKNTDKTHTNFNDIGTLDNKYKASTSKNQSETIKEEVIKVKTETEIPGPSSKLNQKCPCCGAVINKPIQEHLEECGVFANDTSTWEEESPSNVTTIIIDDEDNDDRFDETLTYNATGSKSPCPCCLEMIENADMNDHLDTCLS